MFKSICRESVFSLAVMMILGLPSASHSNPCIGFGVPENYAIPVEGCDSVVSGECRYTPPVWLHRYESLLHLGNHTPRRSISREGRQHRSDG